MTDFDLQDQAAACRLDDDLRLHVAGSFMDATVEFHGCSPYSMRLFSLYRDTSGFPVIGRTPGVSSGVILASNVLWVDSDEWIEGIS